MYGEPYEAPILTGDGQDGFPSEIEFEAQMEDYLEGLNPKKRAKALMTQDMYSTILNVLLEPNSTAYSTAQFRFWSKRMFRLVSTPHANIVAHENRPVAVKDQIYSILVGCHGDAAHGGRDKTSAQVRRYYSWIPKELVSRFVKMCPHCIAKRKAQKQYYGDTLLPPVSIVRPVPRSSSFNEYDYPGEPTASPRGRVEVISRESHLDLEGFSGPSTALGFPLTSRSQSGGSYASTDVEGSEVDYCHYDHTLEVEHQEPFDYAAQYGAYDVAPSDEDAGPTYPVYCTSVLPMENMGKVLDPSAEDDTNPPFYPPLIYEDNLPSEDTFVVADGNCVFDPQPQTYILPPNTLGNHLFYVDNNAIAAQQVLNEAEELAVWEATEQATGGGGSFPLEPPVTGAYLMPPHIMALEDSVATYGLLENEDHSNNVYENQAWDEQDQLAQYQLLLAQQQLTEEPEPLPIPAFEVTSSQEGTIQSRRATKPPPLDLSKTFSLFPLSNPEAYLEPNLRRCATGIPPHLQIRDTDQAPYSAPLQNPFISVPLTSGPSSACSSYSLTSGTSGSSNGLSLPLTPGSTAGLENLSLGPSTDDWQQSSKELAFAIQNLLDSSNQQLLLGAEEMGAVPRIVDHSLEQLPPTGSDRSDRHRTRTRTVSAGGYLRPVQQTPPALERRGSATYGDYEKDVMLRTPRREDARFSPYSRS